MKLWAKFVQPLHFRQDVRQMTKTALVNTRLITMSGKNYDKGAILWEDGRIIDVGEEIPLPPGTQTVDCGGRTVMPGFIDAHTHLGIMEEIYQIEGDDANEFSDPVTPELRALDAINPYDLAFADALKGGVTTVMSGPGSANVIGGTTTVLKTAGPLLDDMVLVREAGLKVAFGENPKHVYAEQKKMPYTRMGIAALLRQALTDAQVYLAKVDKAVSGGEVMERDLGLETLSRVIQRKMPLRAHAHRADDIITAIRVADEFGLDLVIEHGTEAHKIIPEIVRRNIPVVVGPTLSARSKVELAELNWHTLAALQEAGILFAITTDHSVTPVQYLPLCASLAVKYGLDEEAALKAITINPARILKQDHRLGSLENGKDADLVVMSGHPLDWRTRVEKVYVNGLLVYNGT